MPKKFAVIGHPIAHSRSPELHQAFAKAANLQLTYDKILAPLDGFHASVHDFFNRGGYGLNVTVPFKEQAFEMCDELSTRATVAGAVNTMWQQNGKLYGDNTDGQGLVDALRYLNWNLNQAKVLILGAGGATRGVILPLVDAGVTHLTIANRTMARAQQLVEDVQPSLTNTQACLDKKTVITLHGLVQAQSVCCWKRFGRWAERADAEQLTHDVVPVGMEVVQCGIHSNEA
ncbi:MAG: shikimate dehydrogenase, partial [Moraxellaceae bacterium]